MPNDQYPVIPLWPGGAPGSETWEQVERETVMPEWQMPLVHNVVQPSLTVYQPANPSGTAVIVAPGGGFRFLAIEHEGRQVAEWLCAHGITAFILKYRLLRTSPEPWKDAPDRAAHEAEMGRLLPLTHADAAQAMRIVRARAGEWQTDPARIGIMGFSAGGLVASQLALDFTPATRPDFAAVIYGAPFQEISAPAGAPPLFLACAQDDELAARPVVAMYSAWQAAKLPVEMHIYASGSHGFGMRRLGLPCDSWIDRFEDWLKSIQLR